MIISVKYLKLVLLVSGILLVGIGIECNAQSDTLKEASHINNQVYKNESFMIPFFRSEYDETTAPVTLINGKALQKMPTFDLKESLTGLIPNCSIIPVSNQPGDVKTAMRIRGFNYLVLIDGVPRPIDEITSLEVESVNVLRGLSATAMYGPDAMNGIVYIKTKRGNANNKFMDIDVEYGLSTITDNYLPQWLGAFDYANLYNEACSNDGLPKVYSDDALNYYKNGDAPLRYPDENLYSQIYNKNMAYRKVNFSHGGGNENTRFFLNMSYQGEGDHLYKVNSLNSNSLGIRSNLSVNISDFLSLKAGAFGRLELLKTPNAKEQIWPVLGSYPPNAYPVLIAPDTFGTSVNYPINPLGDLTNYMSTKEYNLSGRFDLNLDFDFSKWIRGMKASAFLAYDINTVAAFKERPSMTYALYEPVFTGENIIPDSLIQYGLNNPGAGISQVNKNYQNQFYNYLKLEYTGEFGKHRLNTGLVNKFNSQKYFWTTDRSQDIISQDLSLSLMYSFNNRYALDYILTYSGLMNLPPEKRFKLFPTIGLSWIISEESFLKNARFLNFLKLRASYGTMGFYNSENVSLYNTYWGEGSWTNFNNRTESSRNNYRGTYLIQLGNETIDWATKTELNTGIDANLFSNKLNIGMDYYKIRREGIVMLSPIPPIVGTKNYWENIGADLYRGFDFSFEYNGLSGKYFRYSIGVNAGYNTSEVVATNDINYPYDWMDRVGKPTDAIYGLVAEGLLTENDLKNSPVQTFGEVKEGNIKYKDLNKDGLVLEAIDEKMIGHSAPRINYGINLSFSFKNFSMYMLGYGLADYDVNVRSNPYYYAYGNNKYSEFVLNNRWTTENPDPSARHPRLTTRTNSNDNRNSSYWLVNGGLFSIKNIEVLYRLPESLLVNSELNDISFFIRSKNLLTLSNEKELDPANRSFGVVTYPSMRTFVLGLSLSF